MLRPSSRDFRRYVGLVGCISLLCACEKSLHWKEDVLLQDGRSVRIERKATYGDLPNTFPGGQSKIKEVLAFDDRGKVLTWDITKLSYQSPLVLDYYKGAPLLVLLATGRGDCARFNYPLTGYAAFVWNGSEWQQADEVRIPQALKVNLLSAEDVKRTEYLQGSVVRISDKKMNLGKWPVQQGTELGEVTQKYGSGDQSCGHIRSEIKAGRS